MKVDVLVQGYSLKWEFRVFNLKYCLNALLVMDKFCHISIPLMIIKSIIRGLCATWVSTLGDSIVSLLDSLKSSQRASKVNGAFSKHFNVAGLLRIKCCSHNTLWNFLSYTKALMYPSECCRDTCLKSCVGESVCVSQTWTPANSSWYYEPHLPHLMVHGYTSFSYLKSSSLVCKYKPYFLNRLSSISSG